MPEIVDPFVFDGIDDEGETSMFGGFVQIEVVPHTFVDRLSMGVE